MGETRNAVELPRCSATVEIPGHLLAFRCTGKDVPGHEEHKAVAYMEESGGEPGELLRVTLTWTDES